MVSRAEKSAFGEWWWTVDRLLLLGFLVLIGGGVVMSFAASPGAAAREGLPVYHFIERHLFYVIPAVIVLIATSFLSPRDVRRLCLLLLVISLVALFLTQFIGVENKGSRRWLRFAGFSIQPSEFIKPPFIVVCAWLLGEGLKRPDMPGNLFAFGLLGVVVTLLVRQPDVGQTMLIVMVWSLMFFIASMPWVWMVLLGSAGAGGLVAAYLFIGHVQKRVNSFWFDGESGLQVIKAKESIIRGGWFGVGPGEGTIKRSIPDSHTDFIFAVMGEEYGIIVCLLLVVFIAAIVMRGFWHAFRQNDPFPRLAVAGLTALFGVQSMINIAVNLNMMPTKGMTLPFISYGGSSLIAVAFSTGLLLALSRQRASALNFHTQRPTMTAAMPAPAGAQ
mgnify:CR=1 FL=1